MLGLLGSVLVSIGLLGLHGSLLGLYCSCLVSWDLPWYPGISGGLQWFPLVSRGLWWSSLVSMGLCLVSIVPAWSPGISLCLQGSLLVFSSFLQSPGVSAVVQLSRLVSRGLSDGLTWSLGVSAGLPWSSGVCAGLSRPPMVSADLT